MPEISSGDNPTDEDLAAQVNSANDAIDQAVTGDVPDAEQLADESAPFRVEHTALRCLSLVARHHGVDVSADRLAHDYSLEQEEPSLNRVLRIAKDIGFKSKFTRLTWKSLQKVNSAFPLMVRLKNGNFIIPISIMP